MNDATLTSVLQTKLRKYRVSDAASWLNILVPRISFERHDSLHQQPRLSLSGQITSPSTLEHNINLAQLGLTDAVGCAVIETIQAALASSSSSSSSSVSSPNKKRRTNSSSPSRSKTSRNSSSVNNIISHQNSSPGSRKNTPTIGISSLHLSSYFVVLRLNKNNLTGAVCPCIVALLGASSRIRSLDLTENNLSADAVQTLTNTVHSLVHRPNLFVDSVSMLMSKEEMNSGMLSSSSPSQRRNQQQQQQQRNNSTNNRIVFNPDGGDSYFDEVSNINDVSHISSSPSIAAGHQNRQQLFISSSTPGPRGAGGDSSSTMMMMTTEPPQIDIRAMKAQRDALFAAENDDNVNNTTTYSVSSPGGIMHQNNNNKKAVVHPSDSPSHLKVTVLKNNTTSPSRSNNNSKPSLLNVTHNTYSRAAPHPDLQTSHGSPERGGSSGDGVPPSSSPSGLEHQQAHYQLSPPPLRKLVQSNQIVTQLEEEEDAHHDNKNKNNNSLQSIHHLPPPTNQVPDLQRSASNSPRSRGSGVTSKTASPASSHHQQHASSSSYAGIHQQQQQQQQQQQSQNISNNSRSASPHHHQQQEQQRAASSFASDSSPPNAQVSIEQVDTIPNHASRPDHHHSSALSSSSRSNANKNKNTTTITPSSNRRDDKIITGSYADRHRDPNHHQQQQSLYNNNNDTETTTTFINTSATFPKHQHPSTGATLPDMVDPTQLLMTNNNNASRHHRNRQNNNINNNTSSPEHHNQTGVDVLDFLDISIGMPHRHDHHHHHEQQEELSSSSDDDLFHHGGRKNNNRHWLRAKSLTLLSESNRSGMFRNLTLLELIGLNLCELPPNLPPGLLRLDVSRNEITSLRDIVDSCPHIQVINARRNKLTVIGHHTFQKCPELTHVFLGRNKIPFVEGLAHLSKLETLDLSYTVINSELDIRPLSYNTGLKHLFLEGSPIVNHLSGGTNNVSHQNHSVSLFSTSTTSLLNQRYRLTIRKFCPQLLSLDNIVLPVSRQTALQTAQRQQQQQQHQRSASASRNRQSANNNTVPIATFSSVAANRKIRPEELFDRDRGAHQATIINNNNNNTMMSSSSSSTTTLEEPRDLAPRPWSATRHSSSSLTPVSKTQRKWMNTSASNNSNNNSNSKLQPSFYNETASSVSRRRTASSSSATRRAPSTSSVASSSSIKNNNNNNPRHTSRSKRSASASASSIMSPGTDEDEEEDQEEQIIIMHNNSNDDSLPDISAISNNSNNEHNHESSLMRKRSAENNNHYNNNHHHHNSDTIHNDISNVSTSYIDAEEDNLPQEVQTFADQLLNDLDAASVALRTYISVLGSSSVSSSSNEAKQCVGVVKRSGLLMDTVLPKKVVRYFSWTNDELNVAPNAPEDTSIVDSIHNGDLSGVSSLGATMRQKLLKQIHRLNDAKTCLRYITSLAEAGPSQEQLLKVFIKRVGKTIK